YFHEDALGSVVLVTDDEGNNVEKYEYTEYGLPTVFVWDAQEEEWGTGTEGGASAIGNTRMFTGREWDAEVGLYYYRARHYDPRTGRFVSPDPIGMAGDGLANVFRYAINAPGAFTDPFGLNIEADLADGVVQNAEQGDYISAYISYAGLFYYNVWNAVTFGTVHRQDAIADAFEEGCISEGQMWKSAGVETAAGVVKVGAAAAIGSFVPLARGGTILAQTIGGVAEGAGIGLATTAVDHMTSNYHNGDSEAQVVPGVTVADYVANGVMGGVLGGLIRGLSTARQIEQNGQTPAGRPLGSHYARDRASRNIPGSALDEAIREDPAGMDIGGGKIAHYDPKNNLTVVTGKRGIISSHKGKPSGGGRGRQCR
ncbi:MAG: RHS repeat-associated core domain-containing protein, partial [Candidatus Hydrogenedentes bacterium]|nr:RHS repeat-associated core domain-containing protein [Candidatus Hydrogenedentota bacterium]